FAFSRFSPLPTWTGRGAASMASRTTNPPTRRLCAAKALTRTETHGALPTTSTSKLARNEFFRNTDDKLTFFLFERQRHESRAYARAGDALAAANLVNGAMHVALQVCFFVIEESTVAEIKSNG